MRESIGAVSLLNFVIFFILLIFGFMLGTFSYYKAYRVNNFMVAAIEKYEGFNSLSKAEMQEKMQNLAYNFPDFQCPNREGIGYKLIKSNGKPATNATKDYEGYCVYVKDKDTEGEYNKKDIYDSYQVTTVITFNFPIVQNVIKMKVSSKTNRIYNFECAQATSPMPDNCIE